MLVEAFALLQAEQSSGVLPPLRLKVAGYKSSGDEPYFQSVLQRVRELGLAGHFQFAGELDRTGKIAFLQSLDVMSVPTVYRESKGFSVLEALANGVPVVVPRHGSFPEIIEQTGGGLLCEAENTADLAAKLREYILNPTLAADMVAADGEAIHAQYTAQQNGSRTSPVVSSGASRIRYRGPVACLTVRRRFDSIQDLQPGRSQGALGLLWPPCCGPTYRRAILCGV